MCLFCLNPDEVSRVISSSLVGLLKIIHHGDGGVDETRRRHLQGMIYFILYIANMLPTYSFIKYYKHNLNHNIFNIEWLRGRTYLANNIFKIYKARLKTFGIKNRTIPQKFNGKLIEFSFHYIYRQKF